MGTDRVNTYPDTMTLEEFRRVRENKLNAIEKSIEKKKKAKHDAKK